MTGTPTLHLSQLQVADNVRSEIDQRGLDDLAQSIATVGVLQPITVSPNGTGDTFVLVAGHRRKAAIEKGIADGVLPPDFPIPYTLRQEASDEADRLVVQLIENLQREDLPLMDEARGYARAKDELGLSQKEIARRVGRSEGHVSKRLSLLRLPEDVQAEVDRGAIPVEVAIELPKVSADDARDLVKMGGSLTVRAVKARQDHNARSKAKEKALATLEKDGVTIFPSITDARDACPDGKFVVTGEPVAKPDQLPKRIAGVVVRDFVSEFELIPVTFKKPSAADTAEAERAAAERQQMVAEATARHEAVLASIDNFVDNPPAAAEILALLVRVLPTNVSCTFLSGKDAELTDEGRSLTSWQLAGEPSSVEVRRIAAAYVADRVGQFARSFQLSADDLLAVIDVAVATGIAYDDSMSNQVLGRLAQLWDAEAAKAAETESADADEETADDQEDPATSEAEAV